MAHVIRGREVDPLGRAAPSPDRSDGLCTPKYTCTFRAEEASFRRPERSMEDPAPVGNRLLAAFPGAVHARLRTGRPGGRLPDPAGRRVRAARATASAPGSDD